MSPDILSSAARTCVLASALIIGVATPSFAAQEEKRASFECGEQCEIRLSTNRLLEVRNDEPDVRLRFGGRFHMDGAAIIDDTVPMSNGWRVRRARPEFRARFFEVLKLKVDYEFAPDRQGWRNVWGRYAPTDWV